MIAYSPGMFKLHMWKVFSLIKNRFNAMIRTPDAFHCRNYYQAINGLIKVDQHINKSTHYIQKAKGDKL